MTIDTVVALDVGQLCTHESSLTTLEPASDSTAHDSQKISGKEIVSSPKNVAASPCYGHDDGAAKGPRRGRPRNVVGRANVVVNGQKNCCGQREGEEAGLIGNSECLLYGN